jgi:hypothetical protein
MPSPTRSHLRFAIALLAAAGSPVAAEDVFLDGFEVGTFCPWSFPPTGFEVGGNGLDDDCDGQTDEAPVSCDAGFPSNSGDPLQYAAAINLCQTTTETGHDWGIVTSGFSLASGEGDPAPVSRSIRGNFGNVAPQHGAALVVLSTGRAAATSQTNPSYLAFQNGLDTGTQSAPPADWLAAHGGSLPTLPGCPDALSSTAFNPVMLTYRIRVPGNARSFRLEANFLTAEYPEFVCTEYFDGVVVLLDSEFADAPANPADKNLAVALTPSGTFPIGVNLALGDAGLFTQCQNGTVGCNGSESQFMNNCTSTAGLSGTGMEVLPANDPPPAPWCNPALTFTGGGSDWLAIRGNVVPGENLTLRVAIWDVSESDWDSVVLLDNFQWSTEPAVPGTTAD